MSAPPAVAPPPRRLGRWPWIAAIVVAVLAVAWAAVTSRGTQTTTLAAVIAFAAPLLLLRRRPVPAVAVLLTAFTLLVFTQAYDDRTRVVALVAVGIAVAVTATTSRQLSLGTGLAAVAVLFLDPFTQPQAGPTLTVSLVFAVAVAVAWAVGDSVRQRREYAAALHAQATAQAVTAERLRIARELHDMVAHSMGIIAIQSGVGARVIGSQPNEARNALAAIETASRDTLAGLRRMLAVLRTTDGEPMELASSAPGLADIDALAASTAALGLEVGVVRRGDPRPVPAETGLAAYRIVQESLTNVLRHAGTGHCDVAIEYAARELSLRVTDGGRGATGPSQGFGIVGMRERVHLLGGQFAAGPREGGGFEVSAVLPAPPMPA